MNDVSAYITHLKEAFNASDELIIEKLQVSGWSTQDATNAVKLYMLPDAPVAPNHHATQDPHKVKAPKNALSSLSQAMQHILLWVFTVSTTITLSIVAAALFDSGSSSDVLAIYVAVAIVTFAPFAFVFVDYLKRYRQDRTIVTGRVWSIITIVVHSIASIISGIILIVNLLIDPTMAVIIATTVIILVNLIVVVTYYCATFGKSTSKFRSLVIYSFLPLVFFILSVFGLFALSRQAPIRADEQLRARLVKTAEAVRSSRIESGKLPASLTSIKDVDTKGITYKKKSDTSYELCATFQTKQRYPIYDRLNEPDDRYISEYNFYNSGAGEKCFGFKAYVDYPINTYR